VTDPGLTFEATDLTHTIVVRLYGPFDPTAARIFDEAILPLFDNRPVVVVDLSGLTSFDATGLYCLLHARDQLRERGASLRVTGGGGLVDNWEELAELFEAREA
jgi:anti-anti-sigma factor